MAPGTYLHSKRVFCFFLLSLHSTRIIFLGFKAQSDPMKSSPNFFPVLSGNISWPAPSLGARASGTTGLSYRFPSPTTPCWLTQSQELTPAEPRALPCCRYTAVPTLLKEQSLPVTKTVVFQLFSYMRRLTWLQEGTLARRVHPMGYSGKLRAVSLHLRFSPHNSHPLPKYPANPSLTPH